MLSLLYLFLDSFLIVVSQKDIVDIRIRGKGLLGGGELLSVVVQVGGLLQGDLADVGGGSVAHH